MPGSTRSASCPRGPVPRRASGQAPGPSCPPCAPQHAPRQSERRPPFWMSRCAVGGAGGVLRGEGGGVWPLGGERRTALGRGRVLAAPAVILSASVGVSGCLVGSRGVRELACAEVHIGAPTGVASVTVSGRGVVRGVQVQPFCVGGHF